MQISGQVSGQIPGQVFDGHNDALLRLWLMGDRSGESFITGATGGGKHKDSQRGHLDLPLARAGGFVGGMFAMFVPSPAKTRRGLLSTNPITQTHAAEATSHMLTIAHALASTHHDKITLCATAGEIATALATHKIAMLLHMEGCEAIAPDLGNLDEYIKQGVRAIAPVWSRPNVFATGVPFRFPASPNIGSGLTEAGRALVKACNSKQILLDVSHLNEAGFWDIASLSTAPLVATHSNVHALCASSRNLTQKQLDTIAESGGLVGVNFATAYLRADGKRDPATPLTTILRHIDALLETLGEGGVALGSDFDGAELPHDLANAADLPKLITAMHEAGYGEALIARLTHQNWLDVLQRVIG